MYEGSGVNNFRGYGCSSSGVEMELADGKNMRSEKHPWRNGWSLDEVGKTKRG